MNKTQKIIWTIYLAVLIFFIVRPDGKFYRYMEIQIENYAIFGTVFALFLSWLWRDKKIENKNSPPKKKSKLIAFFSKWYLATKKQ